MSAACGWYCSILWMRKKKKKTFSAYRFRLAVPIILRDSLDHWSSSRGDIVTQWSSSKWTISWIVKLSFHPLTILKEFCLHTLQQRKNNWKLTEVRASYDSCSTNWQTESNEQFFNYSNDKAVLAFWGDIRENSGYILLGNNNIVLYVLWCLMID